MLKVSQYTLTPLLRAPKYIYRYFPTREQALLFTTGQEIRISTFENIRTADSRRADSNEGIITYTISKLDHTTPKKEASLIRKNARDFGIIGDGSIVNCLFVRRIKNAHILCFSLERPNKRMKGLFGEYVVRIGNPMGFFASISRAMRRQLLVLNADFCKVQYNGRSFADADRMVSHPAMANVEANRFEKEIRMLWFSTEEKAIEPIILSAPRTRHYPIECL